jgi:hypothetical protein
VKDLRIEEPIKEKAPPAMPQDPAIIGVSLYNTSTSNFDDVKFSDVKSL